MQSCLLDERQYDERQYDKRQCDIVLTTAHNVLQRHRWMNVRMSSEEKIPFFSSANINMPQYLQCSAPCLLHATAFAINQASRLDRYTTETDIFMFQVDTFLTKTDVYMFQVDTYLTKTDVHMFQVDTYPTKTDLYMFQVNT